MAGIAAFSAANADRFAHGTHARYVAAKCRCDDCRRANREYQHARRRRVAFGGGNPLVSAEAARQHLDALGKRNVGLRAVAEASDVSRSVICDVACGKKLRIRRDTESRILAVDSGARLDGALVPAGPTNAALKKLRSLGLTKTAISERMGGRSRPTQLGNRKLVHAATAYAVDRLLREELAAVEAADTLCGFCEECDEVHTAARRQRILRHVEDRTPARLHEDWPHWWPSTPAGKALLRRDLATLIRGRALRDDE